MNYERVYDCARPRHRVWCKSSELTEGSTSGTFTFNDSAMAAELGEGSEIIVMDLPGKVLFWDKAEQLAYDWTAEEGGA